MLSLSQKESILLKRGIPIPRYPVRRIPRAFNFDVVQSRYPLHQREEDLELKVAVADWASEVNSLYDMHIRRPVETAIQALKASAKSDLPRARADASEADITQASDAFGVANPHGQPTTDTRSVP